MTYKQITLMSALQPILNARCMTQPVSRTFGGNHILPSHLSILPIIRIGLVHNRFSKISHTFFDRVFPDGPASTAVKLGTHSSLMVPVHGCCCHIKTTAYFVIYRTI